MKFYFKKIVFSFILCTSPTLSMMPETTEYNPYDKRYENFKHLDVYGIPELHAKGLTGKGYSASIIEKTADPNHPALNGKIEVVEVFGVKDDRSPEHGNHVSALIVGNKTSEFGGGICPDAYGYVVSNDNHVSNQTKRWNECLEEELKTFEIAAQKSHIINRSGAIGVKYLADRDKEENIRQGLSEDFLDRLSSILEMYDTILVITASNKTGYLGEETKEYGEETTTYLTDLISKPALEKRVLIVGNLTYRSKKESEELEKQINIWDTILLEKLQHFTPNGYYSGTREKIKNKKKTELENYLEMGGEDSDVYKSYGLYKWIFENYYDGISSIPNIIENIKKTNQRDKTCMPEDRDETGVPLSMKAGTAKDHFILAYGTEIRSAWLTIAQKDGNVYENKTGSSQACPITTGILILFHQHLYNNPHKEGSWVELLTKFKASSRKIGDPKIFGLGVLDTTKLFMPEPGY